MSDDIFDFGFTVVDESELEAVKKTQDTANDAEQLATTTQNKLDNYRKTEGGFTWLAAATCGKR